MNLNKIFEFFKSEDDDNPKEVAPVILEGPLLWIGMFKKLIVNYETFTKQIITLFKSTNQDLDIDDIERASSYMVYTRAYDNISNLDINNPDHLDILKIQNDEFFRMALEQSLKYFEETEEYERCAFLKQINDKINSFQG
jgi:hypothetical protein